MAPLKPGYFRGLRQRRLAATMRLHKNISKQWGRHLSAIARSGRNPKNWVHRVPEAGLISRLDRSIGYQKLDQRLAARAVLRRTFGSRHLRRIPMKLAFIRHRNAMAPVFHKLRFPRRKPRKFIIGGGGKSVEYKPKKYKHYD
jgi:hypothetical protein